MSHVECGGKHHRLGGVAVLNEELHVSDESVVIDEGDHPVLDRPCTGVTITVGEGVVGPEGDEAVVVVPVGRGVGGGDD